MRYFSRLLILLMFSSLCIASIPPKRVSIEEVDLISMSKAEVEGYLAGKGMGLAKIAELNGYPGPKHVMDLSKELQLSPAQVQRTQALYDSMLLDSKSLGVKLVKLERDLEAMFDNQSVNEEKLRGALNQIAAVKANIRYVHLNAHIQQEKILAPSQAAIYSQLRGYVIEGDAQTKQSHHH